MFFKNLCILVLWMEVVAALEGTFMGHGLMLVIVNHELLTMYGLVYSIVY